MASIRGEAVPQPAHAQKADDDVLGDTSKTVDVFIDSFADRFEHRFEG